MMQRLYEVKQLLKKIRFIYQPYKRIRFYLSDKKSNMNLIENGLGLVKEIDRTLAETKMMFFADFGTLLGIIREGKLLRWDVDVDFGIIISENHSWKDIEDALFNAGFTLYQQFSFKCMITEQSYKKNNCKVDFFNHFTDGDRSYYYNYYRKDGYIYKNKYQFHVRLVQTVKIYGIEVFPLGDEYVHVPCNAETYLASLYGNNWRIPNSKWEESLRPNIVCLDDSELAEVKYFN